MKKLIITGCNGQLGREMNKYYANSTEFELINTDVGELDITNIDAVMALAREVKPYAIVNCAAHTAVDRCEEEADLAYKINAIGPRNLAIAATETGAKMVQISTDYVLKGQDARPYIEFDPVGPDSMYGKTKLAGENFVKDFSDRFYILRTAWLYGDGKNFVKTMLRLSKERDELTVVNDQFGTPTSTAELAKAIGVLLPTDNYGLFHATCEGSTNWADFAREIFAMTGQKTNVKGCTTEEYNAPAPRPKNSILENYMLKLTTDFMFADWHDALGEYLKTLEM